MNKAELVDAVAAEVGLSKKDVNNVIDALISAITDSLARKEKVTLVGFGTFQVQRRKTRQGVNPQTRAKITIPAKDVPKFKPGKALREAVG
ncbi:integration host factor [Candidatus Aerophobetes bacterium]|uniref:Integration host factor n=1 Tax=Aerophobetes bacterium TaxID=2030807 RepID=A0A497E4L9_UNCAE|nr:HU family DNA-binding protein [Candidatus Aerophobetes bacterium]RLE09747.1 MAG: integration host factor [Candidatus Aerophobetes bacterium]HHJ00863.1 HU family DNA-binding protein [Candidatus Aerophobetes bacterium]